MCKSKALEQTLVYKVISIDKPKEFNDIVFDYTGLFYKLYNHFEESEDKNFERECLNKFPLMDASIYEFCATDVKMSLESYEEIIKEKQDTIEDIDKEIKKLSHIKRLDKKQKRHKKKLLLKKVRTVKSLTKGVCFGGKDILRQITNLKQRGMLSEKEQVRLNKLTKQYRENRKRNIFLIGRACEGSNRKAEINLAEGYIIFKLNRNTHIKFSLQPFKGNKRKNLVHQLQTYIDSNAIAITLRLSEKQVYVTFDNEIINGFGFDNTACNKAIRERLSNISTNEVRQKFHEEKRQRMLAEKLPYRGGGIDMNPKYIGFGIFDVDTITKEVIKVIFTRAYDISMYVDVKNLSKKQRNKFKYEISLIYRDIFFWMKHFRVSFMGIEDTTGITNNQKDSYTNFNRLTKNVWNRTYQENLIKVKCGEKGIRFDEDLSCYSSFIGNIKYNYFDPICASIEIGRRAYTKYIKNVINRIYPAIGNRDFEKMCYLLKTEVSVDTNWPKMYKLFSKSGSNVEGWWRNKTTTEGKWLRSVKSGVKYYVC